MAITVTKITENDFGEWLPLWNANNEGHTNDAVTAQTWARLNDTSSTVNGFLAWDGKGAGKTAAGLIHYILHPVTGHIEPACYMQDVFVAKDQRRKGIARKMVQALNKEGIKQKWARVYWFADNTNESAQHLYKNIGVKLNFSLHIIGL